MKRTVASDVLAAGGSRRSCWWLQALLLVLTLVGVLYAAFLGRGIRSAKVLLRWPADGKLEGQVRAAADLASADSIRIAVVTMTSGPLNLAEWLEHHHRHAGVSRFYLRFEQARLPALLGQPPWNAVVESFNAEAQPVRNYRAQQARQTGFVREAIRRARIANMTHLLHIDDDELLFCPGGVGLLRGALTLAGSQPASLALHNLEALYPSEEVATGGSFSFNASVAFRHDRYRYASYTNGKSFGNLAVTNLQADGVHRFEREKWQATANRFDRVPIAGSRANNRERRRVGRRSGRELDWQLPPAAAVLLHFESPTFSSWLRKFEGMARAGMTDQKFRWYRESLKAAKQLLDAVAAERGVGEAREDAAKLWASWKRQPPHLPIWKLDAEDPDAAVGAARVVILESEGITLLRPLCNI